MRLLSENETALLIGDMSRIQLSDDVELYLSFGVLEVFRRISKSPHTKIERDWVYIPLEMLDTIKQNLNNVPLNSHDSLKYIEPIKCEDHYLFPIYSGQKLDIILVSEKQKLECIDSPTIKCLIKTFEVFKADNQNDNMSHNMFIKTLAENNDSIQGITKAVLNLLVKEIPRSSAGYYSDEKDELYRQFIVGELTKFDSIPQTINDEMKLIWAEHIKREVNLFPADCLSKEIQFMVNPPDLNFIHKGLQSDCSNNYISVILPGNSDIVVLRFLKTISKLMSDLSESQFLKSTSVLNYYQKNITSSTVNNSMFSLFEKLFTLLNQQIRITRLLFLSDKQSFEIGFTFDGSYVTIENSEVQMTSEFKERLLQENLNLLQDSTDEKCYLNLSQHSNSNVNSEFISEFILHNNDTCFIAVGSPKDKNVLIQYSEFIQDSLDAFIKCNGYLYLQDSLLKAENESQANNSRLYLMGKLCNGYFNQIFSKMTVLLCKTEYVKSIIKQKNDDELESLSKYFLSIEDNADQVGGFVTAIRSLIPLEEDKMKLVHANVIMKKLSNDLDGFLHQNHINKNISIRLDNITQTNSGFKIAYADIEDAVIPVLISIINDAGKDGTITMAAKKEFNSEFIQITFNKSLINNDNIDDLIIKPFSIYSVKADDVGMFRFSKFVISSDVSKGEIVTVKFRLKQNTTYQETSHDGPKGVLERV